MKKIIFLFIILLSLGAAWETESPENEKVVTNLDLKICNLVLDNEKRLRKKGIETEGLAWGAMYWLRPGSKHGYPFNFEEGKRYIFYTSTTGPKAKIMVAKDDGKEVKSEMMTSDNIIFSFSPSYTGEYHYFVYGIMGKGIHVSYFTFIMEKK
jgi:hypothetical protein